MFHTNSDKEIIKLIGEKLKKLRLNNELSQDDLAIKAGISRLTISNMETGHSFTIENLVKVLRQLNKLDELDNFLSDVFALNPIDLIKLEEKQNKKRIKKSRKL